MLFNPFGGRIPLKGAREVARMREAGKLAAEGLAHLIDRVRPGVSTIELDEELVRFAKRHDAGIATLGYMGFPRAICTAVNEVICHGIPRADEVLQDGDIIGVDVTLIWQGYHGDTAATVPVGRVDGTAKRLLDDTLEALRLGVAAVEPGGRIGAIGAAIQGFAEARGYGVVRDFVGHGIGRRFHEPPHVPHFGTPQDGALVQPGMTFTIEPMLNLGTAQTKTLRDGWTVVTADRSLSAQFEHTVAVTRTGVEILTARHQHGAWEAPAGWSSPG